MLVCQYPKETFPSGENVSAKVLEGVGTRQAVCPKAAPADGAEPDGAPTL